MTRNPVEKAIKAAGTQQALADGLHLSRPAIALWKKKGEIPLKYLKEASKVTNLPVKELLSKQQKVIAEGV